MDFLVEFMETGARVIKDPNLINLKKNNDNVLLNPDISHLAGISPSFWIKNGDKIEYIGIDKSKEVVFNGKLFSPSFDNKITFPEPISINIEKLEQLMRDNDAKHEKSIDDVYKKIENTNQAIVLILEDFNDDLQKSQKSNGAKILITNILVIASFIALFFLKFK